MAYPFIDQMYDSISKIIKPKISVLADLLSKKNSERLKIIDRVKIPLQGLKEMRLEINDARVKGMITEDLDYIYINAKGIYYVENERGRFRIDDFIEFLNSKYFDLLEKKHKPLGDRRKLILFFLISIRSFSKDSSLRLNRSVEVLDSIKEYIRSCTVLLTDLKVINKDGMIEELEKNKNESEHLVSNLLRHSEDIQIATEQIFNCPGGNQYFINVSENNNIDVRKLAFLFHKIFSNMLSQQEIEQISTFCNKLSKEAMFTVYDDISVHAFRELKYNSTIKEALSEYNKQYFG